MHPACQQFSNWLAHWMQGVGTKANPRAHRAAWAPRLCLGFSSFHLLTLKRWTQAGHSMTRVKISVSLKFLRDSRIKTPVYKTKLQEATHGGESQDYETRSGVPGRC